MYVSLTIKDTVKVACHLMRSNIAEATTDQIHRKYSNRVLRGEGICVAVIRVVQLGTPYIHPTKGAVTVRVTFEVLVFKPFLFEILMATVYSCDASGIVLSLGFHLVTVLKENLPTGSYFCDGVWIRELDGARQEIEDGCQVRFKVMAVDYNDSIDYDYDEDRINIDVCKRSDIMMIKGSLVGEGLGVLSWWDKTSMHGTD